ncbi:DNA-binding transcriptional LysR family regulator [Rhizobium sp. BK529]|uniref:LysR family transcriptional regulator n=1 Tax=Rhizobium sp. BK529 TaxID=2586983 RepID=UPI00160EABE3|nr:LysR family transcriptional regulator [Rhizobium sp. BK529]MBB3595157.1 DNA-binding transcriptional LysR family regulator [Rhizobium sp. BK529]
MIRNDVLNGLSWDDFRIVKAIGDAGSLASAAAMISVNTSTISRRLTQIETILGAALFERRRTGYAATEPGREVIALAKRLELDIVSVSHRISGQLQQYTGRVKVATSDSLAFHVLTPVIAEFRKSHPAITVELLIGNASLNLARGEADIALRATDSPPESLIGKKISTIGWALYGCKRIWRERRLPIHQCQPVDWIGFGGALSSLKANTYVDSHAPQTKGAFRVDSIEAAAAAISANIGVGYLPCMLGDLHPGLTRIGAIEPSLSSNLWLLTHPDIRRTPRVNAFMTLCARFLAKQRDLIQGKDLDESRLPASSGAARFQARNDRYDLNCDTRDEQVRAEQ